MTKLCWTLPKVVQTFYCIFSLLKYNRRPRARGRPPTELNEKAETFLTRSAAGKYGPARLAPDVSRWHVIPTAWWVVKNPLRKCLSVMWRKKCVARSDQRVWRCGPSARLTSEKIDHTNLGWCRASLEELNKKELNIETLITKIASDIAEKGLLKD